MRELLFYKTITPNRDENSHFVFTNVADYIDELSDYLVGSLEFPNWRLNKGQIIISSEKISIYQANLITYIIDYDDINNYFKCYHVNSSYDQSGYTVFVCDIDRWASFIPFVEFGKNKLIRSNLNFSDYSFLDKIENAGRSFEFIGLSSSYTSTLRADIDEFELIFQLEYNISASVFGTNQITRKSLLGINLRTLTSWIAGITGGGTTIDDMDIIAKCAEFLGGVYSVGNNEYAIARALRAWIVPTARVTYSDVYLTDIWCKSLVTNLNKENIANVHFVSENDVQIEMYFDYYMSYFSHYANYKFGLGCKYHYLEIPTFTYYKPYSPRPFITYSPKDSFTLHFNFSDVVKCEIYYLGEKIDLSDDLEIPFTTNNETNTTWGNVTKAIQKIGGGITAVATGAAAGGWVGAAVGAAAYGLKIVSEMQPAKLIEVKGSGNAYQTYSRQSAEYVDYPFVLNYLKTMDNEIEKAQRFGMSTLQYDFGLSSVENYEIYEADYIAYEDRPFVQYSTIEISGINHEAKEFIASELTRGVYLKVI